MLVYVNTTNVVDYLVESISKPARDPNAGEVYYRLMTRFLTNQSRYTLDSVLSKMTCPLLLLWGELDPWVGPAKAEKKHFTRTHRSCTYKQGIVLMTKFRKL